jgi:hypothetical protein
MHLAREKSLKLAIATHNIAKPNTNSNTNNRLVTFCSSIFDAFTTRLPPFYRDDVRLGHQEH